MKSFKKIPYYQSNSDVEGLDNKMFKFKNKRLLLSHLGIALFAFGIGSLIVAQLGTSKAATIYYVSTTGSDSAAGSSTAPYKTIQKAIATASSGDTIMVKPGAYPAPVSVSKSGITLKSESNWAASIDGNNTAANGFVFGSGINGVTIDGFEIKNLRSSGGSSSGIELYNGGANSTLRNNNIHSIGRQCTSTSNGLVGIFNKASGVTIENNYIHDIGRLQPSEGCSSGDALHDHGIYMNSSSTALSGVKVLSNTFFRIDRGWAVQFYPGSWKDTVVDNNTFAYGNPTRQLAHVVIYDMTLTNVSFTNNTFYNTTTNCRSFTLGGKLVFSNVTVSGNKTTCSGLTDTTPPSGWNASNNTLSASISVPVEPTSGTVVTSSPETTTTTTTSTTTSTPTTALSSNEWSKWGLEVNATTSQQNNLNLQFDANKTGYAVGQYIQYCIKPATGALPKSVTFNVTYNTGGTNQVYLSADGTKIWRGGNVNSTNTTRTETIALQGQQNICFGNTVTSGFSSKFTSDKYFKINSYTLQ